MIHHLCQETSGRTWNYLPCIKHILQEYISTLSHPHNPPRRSSLQTLCYWAGCSPQTRPATPQVNVHYHQHPHTHRPALHSPILSRFRQSLCCHPQQRPTIPFCRQLHRPHIPSTAQIATRSAPFHRGRSVIVSLLPPSLHQLHQRHLTAA